MRRLSGTVCVLLLTAALAVGSALSGAQAPEDATVAAMIARIEAKQVPDRQGFDGLTMAQLMERFRVPGVSIAVIKDFKIHWAKGYGYADVTSGAPVTRETMFQAASISKPTAAIGVMRLVQEGKLALDTDVNTYLKSWKLPAGEFTRDRPVTLRSLLSHTSGLGDGFGFPGYHPKESLPTVVQILNGEKPSNTGRVLMERPPYSAFKYSGGGVTIVQLAATDTTGRPFAELMKSLVLDPIGMTSSGFDQPLSPERDRLAARAHNGRGMAMDAKWHVYPELEAAGLWTTPSDLAKMAIEIQNAIEGRSTVLTAASAREMVTPVGVGDFAVGFGLRRLAEGWYFSHGGSNWGFQCDLTAHVRKGYGVAIMTNADGGSPLITELRNRVAAAYNWDTLDKPVPR